MQLTQLATVPFIVALVELAKQYGLPGKYAPIAALVLGVIGSILVDGLKVESGLAGVVLGLTASGLYSGTKSVIRD